MNLLTIQDFAAWVGRDCRVTAGEVEIEMKLLAVEPVAGSSREGGGFRLEFLGPYEPVLPQATMEVAGPDAAYDIFMVPNARTADGTRYEAIFF